ncbi:MAG: EamA family transporter [Anaerolineaceae bacterium]|nr:EamA family transporter [Anaerolineaceae bacterium]
MDTAIGLLFAFLWASGPIAAKYGFQGSQPLTILEARFFFAALIMLTLNYGIQRGNPLPKRSDWKHIVVLALTNSTIYLSMCWLAVQQIPAGMLNLFIACNPFLVAIFSGFWLGRKVSRQEWLGMIVSFAGLIIATAPSITVDHAGTGGIIMAIIGVVTYAFGSVYFKWAKVELSGRLLNGWQIALGGIFLLPFAAALNGPTLPPVTPNLVIGLSWSVIAISIIGLILWFHILKKDPVRANMWMFLTPILGYLQAAVVLGEHIRVTDVIGTVFVLLGLIVSGTIEIRWWGKTESPLVPAD